MINRREFVRGAGAAVAVAPLLGCGKRPAGSPPLVDSIISGLKVADRVLRSLLPIVGPLNPAVSGLLTTVDADVQVVVKTYEDYDSAPSATKADLIRSTGEAIQTNLSGILTAVGVKDQALVVIVRTAVAVVNTVIIAVIAALPQGTVAHAAVVSTLPHIQGDSSPVGLKKAWNEAVAAHPEARI